MTREKKNEILKELWKSEKVDYTDNEVREALDMAIKDNPCEDAISRKEAIEAFRNWILPKFKDDEPIMALIGIEEIIYDLPSVTPTIPCEDAVNIHDVIERVWEKLSEGYAEKAHTSLDVRDWFSDLPPVTPKPTECEDAVSRTWIREHLGMFLRGCRAERTYEEIAEDVEAYIDYAPPVTPKQRTGHWIPYVENNEVTVKWVCSSCKRIKSVTNDRTEYCPECGAKMEG